MKRIATLEKQCEDATTSAASSAFSRFSQQDFKDLAIQTNQEQHELLIELFKTLDDILETHVSFGKMFVALENQVAKGEQASKDYDVILDWQRYMKDRLENITILSSFQLNNVRTVLRAWLDLNEMIE